MFLDAKKDPKKWPGCVEVGMNIMKPLFQNHVRRPCVVMMLISCENLGWS